MAKVFKTRRGVFLGLVVLAFSVAASYGICHYTGVLLAEYAPLILGLVFRSGFYTVPHIYFATGFWFLSSVFIVSVVLLSGVGVSVSIGTLICAKFSNSGSTPEAHN